MYNIGNMHTHLLLSRERYCRLVSFSSPLFSRLVMRLCPSDRRFRLTNL